MSQNIANPTLSALPNVLVSQQLAATETTQYTCPASSAVKLATASLTNTSGAAVTVSVSVLKTGQTADGTHRVLSGYSLAAGDSTVLTELAGVFLGPGDFISAIASATIQTVTITGAPTGGTFTLTYNGQTTAGIAFNATGVTVQTAFQALSTVGSNATVTGSAGGPYTVTFIGAAVPMTASGASLTGGASPSVTVATVPAVTLVVSGVVFS